MKGTVRSKKIEDDILSTASKILERPEIIIPKCLGECKKCPFTRIKTRIERIADISNERKIQSWAKKGDMLVRGFAVLSILNMQGRIPILARARYADGDAHYAVRGKVDKDVLVGLQNFDNEIWRLYAYKKFAKKNKLWIASTKNGIFCMGRNFNINADIIADILSRSKYGFVMKDGGFRCGRGDIGIVISLGKHRIFLSSKCCRDDTNIYGVIVQRITGPDVEGVIDVSVRCVECAVHCDSCVLGNINVGIISEYRARRISDREFVKRACDGMIFGDVIVHGRKCYGKDIDAFLNDFCSSEFERVAIRTIYSGEKQLIIPANSDANSIIKRYWDKYGRDILKAMGFDRHVDIDVKKVANVWDAVLEKIETLNSLPPEFPGVKAPHARLAHEIVLAYRTEGKSGALRRIFGVHGEDIKTSALLCGFLFALGEEKNVWRFDNESQRMGKVLSSRIRRLLDAEKDEYFSILAYVLRDLALDDEADMLENFMP